MTAPRRARLAPLPAGATQALARGDESTTPRPAPPLAPGAAALRGLSDAELLATFLGRHDRAAPLVEKTRDLLAELGGLAGLAALDRQAADRRRLGGRQATLLLAAVELAARLARTVLPLATPFARPREVVDYLWQRYGASRQELIGAAWLDGRRRLISERVPVRGALQPLALDPLQVVDEAFVRGASGILLFHLRPPGEPGPSPEALALSRRLLERCEERGLDFVDHLVIRSPAFWISLREFW
ncbi:MAG TPA: JAB domain-containing protein [Thermoanaerobaculia bacterium]|nr:JAB domain-containing protein [Thermoanaerobaculia bacterium]